MLSGRVRTLTTASPEDEEGLVKSDQPLVIGRLRMRSWETPEGQRRSVVEVEADEVAPSLKFATAKPRAARRRCPVCHQDA